MRRWIYATAALGCALMSNALFAQQTCSNVSLPIRTGWVEFEIVLGKVAAVNLHQCKSRSATRENPLTGARESYTLAVKGNSPKIRYEASSRSEKVAIYVNGQTEFDARRTPLAGDKPPLRYTQRPGEGVFLTVGVGEEQITHRASTLWHLYALDPIACESHLSPVLSLLRSDWRLNRTAREIEQRLLTADQQGDVTHRPQWEEHVRQLDDRTFARRREAQQKLRLAGARALPFLHECQMRPLSAEQRFRIADLIDVLSVDAKDTPQLVSRRMIEDKAFWLSLMARHDTETRRIAAGRFSTLCQHPIEFDPHAAETVRRDQIARIRSRNTRN